jgi:Glycosyl transferase family 2
VIVSVTTLKDSLANVRKLVSRNLNGGVDHLVVFLDGEQPEVEEFLSGHPDVTCVAAYGDWWDERPDNLNRRQSTNSGLMSRMLDGYDWARWLVHIDGDEVARLDRGSLEAVTPDWQAVRLEPLEAVARMHADSDPVLFKRLLSKDELVLLSTLGVVAKSTNRTYFRGHVAGKLAVRPSKHLALTIHKAVTAEQEKVPVLRDGRQHVLHYESPNGDEFVRKWVALLTSGDAVRQVGPRAPMARALAALLRLGLGEGETAHFVRVIYERHAVDDVETLDRLGFLVRTDADAPMPAREPFQESAKQELRALVDRLRRESKRPFRPSAPVLRAVRAVDRVHRDLGR